jgi:antitoxin (DNA-binding transcriptional repressor) of toxin-antitoxin stability system
MYVVQVKRVTASEARKRWFQLLDEAAAGEVIVLERRGRRLVLRREEPSRGRRASPTVAAYRRLLNVPDLDEADRWGWVWGPRGQLRPVRRPRR